MCVTLTPAAAKFMSRMIRFGHAGNANDSAGFRLSVKPGGCSGFDSSFSVEAAPQPGDTVVLQEGVTLFLPAETCDLLSGYTVDFHESRLEGGFAFTNPAKPHACGCSSMQAAADMGVQVVQFRPPSCSKGS